MSLFSKERLAECAAIRATYVAKQHEWVLRDATQPHDWVADFGDYYGSAYKSIVGGWHWAVGWKIMNELFGHGRIYVTSGECETLEDAQLAVEAAVENDRPKRVKK